ncbi:MAG: 16S rRNA (cytidine(1402)-2'-O)-methyltransferase [Anaerolineales bacterium]|nr:16S rRNA (cytidine(1402)-2'-O)-methyltransferase [Anaerolineales bacterium]
MGTLYLVATPIGNLEDITARAVRVLGQVRLVAAEDTRRTKPLLAHLGLSTETTSYFEHNKLAKLDHILSALELGDVALVSDAGTPAISDPGYELVRAALAAGHAVTPIPGASALLAALAASGLPTDAFVYLGFLPRKSAERRSLLVEMARERRTLVAYEAPHRLLEALDDLQAVLGDRPAAVARELTKLHEEIYRGPISAARAHFAQGEVLGEITLVIGGAAAAPPAAWSEAQVRAEVAALTAGGLRLKDAARQVAERAGWAQREVYRLAAQDPAADSAA